jgi:uncharacterized protein YcfJ
MRQNCFFIIKTLKYICIRYKPQSQKMKKIISLFTAISLASCATASFDISSYSPVMDVREGEYEVHSRDLKECRYLGMKARDQYKKQREKEKNKALGNAVVGALLGATLGAVIDGGDGAADGAVIGGAVGVASGAEQVDFTRRFVKLGPAGIVDECMSERGWSVLSSKGMGGG